MKKKHEPNCPSRRTALKLAGASLAAGAIGWPKQGNATSSSLTPAHSGPGHIVKVHMPGMRGRHFPYPEAARTMVDKAVTTLAGTPELNKAWRHFVSDNDKILLKINCLGTRMVSSMKEVVYAVVDSLVSVGFREEQLSIFDMFASNMGGGRYKVQSRPGRLRVLAHRDGTYQRPWVKAGPAKARFSDTFLESTAVINIPVIKDHDLAGVTCCMKNVTFGVVEKPHLNHGIVNEAIAHLWALDEIRSRIRLNLIDGSTILYDGGPKYNRNALVPHECLYATTDPVAMDAHAGQLIASLRKENGMRSLAQVGRPPKFIKLAQELGLGIADLDKINLETIELPAFSGHTV